MFLFYDAVYLLTYKIMLSDISARTLFVIGGSLTVTALGEYAAYKVRVSFVSKKKRINNAFYWTGKEICVSKIKVYLVTAIFLLVAISRFKNLMRIAREFGNAQSGASFIVLMGIARTAMIDSKAKLQLGNFFTNQLVYISEIAGYFFLFVFLYNLIVCKKRKFYLLFPLVPDFLMRLVSTSRTAFLMNFLAFIVLYFMVQHKDVRTKTLRIPSWLLLGGVIFVILFLWYGISRNNVFSIPLIDYLQMYTCSAIYALDYKLLNGWTQNLDFGYNTLRGIYEMLGIPMKQEIIWGKGMLTFNVNGYHSNIYTSLLAPIQDYGYLGMLVIRFIEAFISTKIIGFLYTSTQEMKKIYIWMYLALMSIYCYFYYSTGDVFPSFFAQPDVMIRYFVYGWCFLIFLNPKGIDCRGKFVKSFFSFNTK